MMYRTQCDALRTLPPDQFKSVVTALWDYEMDGTEPQGDPVVMAMFLMAKPLIDRRNQHYENGKKGGRPKKENQTETEENLPITEQNLAITESEPNQTVKDKGKRIKVKDNIYSMSYPYKEVIDYLNLKAGTHFRESSKATQKHIKARFDEGFTLADFRKVIDGRVSAWKNDAKMSEYLRPETLFGSKFEGYLNAKQGRKSTGFKNFEQRDYNWSDLETKLIQAQG